MDADAVVLIVLAVAAGSVLKGITGVGGPIVAIPIIAATLGVQRAVVVMAIPGLLMNAWLVWRHRAARTSIRDLPVLVATGIVGVVVGVWGLVALDERALSAVLAAAIVAYLVVRLVRPSFEITPRTGRALSPLAGFGSGLLQGSTGMSAPVVATWVHGLNLPRGGYVLAVTLLFGIFSVAQVTSMTTVGLYTWARVAESLLAAVPALALLPLGDRIGRRLSHRSFNRVVLVSLALLATKLLWDVATA